MQLVRAACGSRMKTTSYEGAHCQHDRPNVCLSLRVLPRGLEVDFAQWSSGRWRVHWTAGPEHKAEQSQGALPIPASSTHRALEGESSKKKKTQHNVERHLTQRELIEVTAHSSKTFPYPNFPLTLCALLEDKLQNSE
jgi:hypothetical protein